ncbi:MAG: helix-turn-helix domain-containing protein [Bacteroidales bacterium]
MFFQYILFAPSMVSLFWCIYFLIKKNENTVPQNIMIAITLVFTALFYNRCYCAINPHTYPIFPRADIIDSYLTLAIPPLFYLLFKAMTAGRIRITDAIAFIPGAVIGFCINLTYILMSDQERMQYALEVLKKRNGLFTGWSRILKAQYWFAERIYYIILALSILIVLYYAITRMRKYHREVQNFYSCVNTMKITENTRIYQLLVPFFILLFVFTSIIYTTSFTEYSFILIILSIFETMLIFGLCYYTSLINHTFADYEKDLTISDAKAETAYDPLINDDKQIRINPKDFEYVLLKKELFLQPAIRIDEVARLLCTNRSYLSKMINDVYQMSFSTYINTLRISHAKRLMLSNKDLTQDLIASQSGFINAPSFNRVFKSITDMTPRTWLENELSKQKEKS